MDNKINKFFLCIDKISEYYDFLVKRTKNHEYVDIVDEWIIDNYYLFIEHKNLIIDNKRYLKRKIVEYCTLYGTLLNIVKNNNYYLTLELIISQINEFQNKNDVYFSYKEIELIPTLLTIIYTEKMSEICANESKRYKDKTAIEKVLSANPINTLKLEDFAKEGINLDTNYFIFEFNDLIKNFGSKANKIYFELDKMLENAGLDLKEILNFEYQRKVNTGILIENIFNNLKLFFELNREDLFEGLSYCEKILLKDKIYKNMTISTKDMYRHGIIKLSKKAKTLEYYYIKDLVERAGIEEKHIGEYLIKNKNSNTRAIMYVICITVLTCLVAGILGHFLVPISIIGFLVLLFPLGQLFCQIINQFLMRINKPQPLAKMDYSEGIPEDKKTIVVIPTIIADTNKIKKMFENLETFYIINKSENLYFALLADAKAYKEEEYPEDENIIKFGKDYCNQLNKKYKKELFFFAYRKRIWNEKENSYLGYERKRGALLHFNKLLLGKFSDSEQEKFFHTHNLTSLKNKIKYVITLDVDTKLVLNTALDLVGTMSHPLNKPILNKEKTRVVKGYGILQPKLSVDIEATNQSLYSQIFAAIGGFDSYGALTPNFYQDVFSEGSFYGKGIYDLELFEKLLSKTFPENKILSHDLIECNYLRCGYVADVELIDDFPSKFSTDVTRQHRWARGDTQIIGWLKRKVQNRALKKVKNPLSILGQWKIFDNIARLFMWPSLLIILIFAFVFKIINPWIWLLIVVAVLAVQIFYYLKSKLYNKKRDLINVYYKKLWYGGKSIIVRSYIMISCIPFYSKLYLDAFLKSLYRLLISKKSLLNWITAEEAEKTSKNSFISYIKMFSFNLIICMLFILYMIFFDFQYSMLLTTIIFASAPLVIWIVSQDMGATRITLTDKEVSVLEKLASQTWKYFEDTLTEENNFLIPDNYQENRELKFDKRTSPTNIGFSLVSVISAYELGIIKLSTASYYLKEIFKTIKSLETWNGHLYNWYNIETKKPLYPFFVSTVDSGNLIASLIVTEQFFIRNGEISIADEMYEYIRNADFTKLYTKKDEFSIGYDETEGKLSPYNYNKFASESRLTSYLAIAKGDAPSKHWMCLDKSLTTYKGQKGLISWSGTSFEYYMPLIFNYNYTNTLLDESYKFAYFCQKEYIEEIDRHLPWGISESAYSELDNSLNYKYRTFSTPYLKAKIDKDNRVVVSPYASIMALEFAPKQVIDNIEKYNKLDMSSDYGLFESYDYDNEEVVKSYFAHHQGMILSSIVNYLKNNIIKNYFHSNIKIKTYELLLKEKVQIKSSLNLKIDKYKKYNYEKQAVQNYIRSFNHISDMPEVSVLSNKKYMLLMNDRGNSFSRYRTIQLNRYRKVTEQDYGIFLYIKNLRTQKIWSNTFAPLNVYPDKYEATFANDRIKYNRTDGHIKTKTEIVVTKDHHAEIRKVTFVNNSNYAVELELTTYTEPILSDNLADVSHRVFNNMFLDSMYDNKTDSLLFKRKNRTDKVNNWMIHKLLIENPLEKYQYETSRAEFIGRNHNAQNPIGLNKKMSNKTGSLLDSVACIRNVIAIEPWETKSVYIITGFGRSKEQLLDIINTYSNETAIENAFKISTFMNTIIMKNLNITGEDMRLYNIMLNYLYQSTKIAVNEERKDLLRKNALAQNSLWKYGVSGDRPIILVNIHDISDLSFVKEILKAFEYYKSISIFVDIIIINSEDTNYAGVIKKEVNNALYRMNSINSFSHVPGSVFLIDKTEINNSEMSLLNIVPRLKFDTKNNKSLSECVEDLQKKNSFVKKNEIQKINDIDVKYPTQSLINYNKFGGFTRGGKEYVITKTDTPTPWCNVMANNNFGSVVTNTGCGFTFAYNSGEFKITSWTNDTLCNDKSEGFIINGELVDPSVCIHGFGYTKFLYKNKSYSVDLTEFIPCSDSAKIYLLTIENQQKNAHNFDVDFWINPVLGNYEEKTARHILVEQFLDHNYINLRNVYSTNYNNINVFVSSSEKITKVVDNKILTKTIGVNVNVSPKKTKTITFIIGANANISENLKLIEKYRNSKLALKELEEVKKKWDQDLRVIDVKTPDKSFDYMVNNWYLYQVLSSRILGRTGFYQVSGAFGYRDQLQDAINIVNIKPDFARNQIIKNASHQFIEGDVLHWWNEHSRFGLRSRYKDDYLWLIFALIEYINSTGDYSILNEKVPFVEGPKLKPNESEIGLEFLYSKDKKTILDHALLAINLATTSIGRHGLPLMGGGDWNDGMNKVGINGKGESVWLGFFLYDLLNKFISLLSEYDSNIKTERYIEFNKNLKESLNKNAWDGDYYLRAFFDNGNAMGSKNNIECKIDLISQSFSILTGVIPENRIEKVIKSVEDNLVDKKNKIIKLLTPPFVNSKDNPGYIMNYPAGVRENGGQYTHSVAWYIKALIMTKNYDKAYEYFQMINPINRSLTSDDVKKYKVEPYVIAADIYSAERNEGRGGWTWYTGSAGWFYKVGINDIIGFNKNGEKLFIEPHVPIKWKNYEITYRYIDTMYNINVIIGKDNNILINGKNITTSYIPLVNDKKEHKVEVRVKRKL